MGGCLDLIVSSSNLEISDCKVFPFGIFSDHSFICATLPLQNKCFIKTKKLVRSWRRMYKNDFVSLIRESSIGKPFQMNDVDQAFDLFNHELLRIVDRVAPLHFVYSKHVPLAPWFDDECRNFRRRCRKLERLFRHNPNLENRRAWVAAINAKSQLFSTKKNNYWANLVQTNRNNPKKLWCVIDKILCKESSDNFQDIPTDHSPSNFADYFKNKVNKVREQTGEFAAPAFANYDMQKTNKLTSFSSCSEIEVKKIIMNSPTKSCSLDYLPTHVFKEYVDLFVPFLTGLINLCFSSGCFPSACKHAIVMPLLKKSTLDRNNLKNYRPVSNLSFVSKVIERIAAKQLLNHLTINHLMPVTQSGYRQYHSTETALLHVASELFATMDEKKISLLALLDMSAAFDCVDHEILLERFHRKYGISDAASAWLKSYLIGRTLQVCYENQLSDKESVLFCVPQGSVLGPLLFLLYTADVSVLVNNYGFKMHAFADDIQIVASCPVYSINDTVKQLFNCLSDVDVWMSQNRLKLNQSKTQLLPVGTWQQLSKINFMEIQNTDEIVKFSSEITNLGFIFDSNLSMHEHIKRLTCSCSMQLRKLRLIRSCLNKSTIETLIHAFVHSRLDYCNSLFYGIPNKSSALLQSIQNRAAKIVVGGLKYDHVSPILKDLHWLTVDKRVLFKIGTLMYKCVNGFAPDYLTNKLTAKASVSQRYQLRSNYLNFLIVPPTRLVIGSRNFAVFGPVVWNGLPESLRNPGLTFPQFRKYLKAFLFSH